MSEKSKRLLEARFKQLQKDMVNLSSSMNESINNLNTQLAAKKTMFITNAEWTITKYSDYVVIDNPNLNLEMCSSGDWDTGDGSRKDERQRVKVFFKYLGVPDGYDISDLEHVIITPSVEAHNKGHWYTVLTWCDYEVIDQFYLYPGQASGDNYGGIPVYSPSSYNALKQSNSLFDDDTKISDLGVISSSVPSASIDSLPVYSVPGQGYVLIHINDYYSRNTICAVRVSCFWSK